MSLYTFFRISKPSQEKVPDEKVRETYMKLRNNTFWGATAAYSLFYLCRLSMGVVKKPIIDEGLFSASELGIIASAFYFVYAIGKFLNGFMADYCNVRRYMATGLVVSSVINLIMGLIGLGQGYMGFPPYLIYLIFALLWGINGWVLSMGSPSGIVSLSRWFPQSRRGTFYSIFCSTPYIGEALSMVLTGSVVAAFGWEYGFIASALGGFIGVGIILTRVSDTPQSKGLPSIQEISGEEVKPALISGFVSLVTLALFLLVDGGKVMMAAFVSLFSLAVGVLYCIVSGLMAIDIVPRKATGAALGIVGISSYITIGIQNIVSGVLIDKFAVQKQVMVDGCMQTVTEYNFVPVAIFWLVAVLISFLLPVFNWKKLRG